jgi:RHS repeat-associated protein
MAEANAFRFSTKYGDSDSGLVYYGYRHYSPQLGRWHSRDPIGAKGGVNEYAMVANRPAHTVDFDGRFFGQKSPAPQPGDDCTKCVCGDTHGCQFNFRIVPGAPGSDYPREVGFPEEPLHPDGEAVTEAHVIEAHLALTGPDGVGTRGYPTSCQEQMCHYVDQAWWTCSWGFADHAMNQGAFHYDDWYDNFPYYPQWDAAASESHYGEGHRYVSGLNFVFPPGASVASQNIETKAIIEYLSCENGKWVPRKTSTRAATMKFNWDAGAQRWLPGTNDYGSSQN